MNPPAFDVLVFDLGGVLVDHDGLPFARRWSGDPDMTSTAFWEKWLRSPAARAFEAGRIHPDRFADEVIREFGLHVHRAEFLDGFRHWIRGPIDGADGLLASLHDGGVTLATLSNTNALHWDRLLHDMPFMQRFDVHFPSHLTGYVKPDRETFDHVAEAVGVGPARILLLDDNETNVAGARAAGWRAEIAHGVQGARRALERLGLEINRTV